MIGEKKMGDKEEDEEKEILIALKQVTLLINIL